MARFNQGNNRTKAIKDPYHWQSSVIAGILRKKEYLGHTVNFKTRKHFKDKKSHYVDEDEWQIFENTQEPIIDEVTFNNVQRIRDNVKRYPDGWGEFQPLKGLVYCADCGGKLYCHRTMNGKKIPTFVCGSYGKMPIGTLCPSRHAIKAETLMKLISDTLNELKKMSNLSDKDFLDFIQSEESDPKCGDDAELFERLNACNRRYEELETLLCKIYEDNALGKLPDSRYSAMSRQYTEEQEKLSKEIANLNSRISIPEKPKKDGKKFLELIKRYENYDEITPYMLNEFIEKVVVHERDRKGSSDTTQRIDIFFNFIGQIEIPAEEIDPEEQARLDAERAKKEATKERLRRNYLKRKASGKQKEYEASYAAKRRARMLELKAENPNTYGISLTEYREMVRKQKAEHNALLVNV